MSKCIYEVGTCYYCGDLDKPLRPSPFMGDIGSMMCKACWDDTEEEYAGSEDACIGKFEDGPGFDEIFIPPTEEELATMTPQSTKDFENLIRALRLQLYAGTLDATIGAITQGEINSVSELVCYLNDDLSYAAKCTE